MEMVIASSFGGREPISARAVIIIVIHDHYDHRIVAMIITVITIIIISSSIGWLGVEVALRVALGGFGLGTQGQSGGLSLQVQAFRA